MKNILQAIVLVAIILAVFLWNPWNMFGGGLKFHQTTNHVSAIREIGELVTAEYYGEAISTLKQSKLRLIEADDINNNADIQFKGLKQDMLSVYANDLLQKQEIEEKDGKKGFWSLKWFRRAKKQKKETIQAIQQDVINIDTLNISKDTIRQEVIQYYWIYKSSSSFDDKKIEKNKVNLKNALYLLYEEVSQNAENLSDTDFSKYMEEGLPQINDQVFSDYHHSRIDTEKDNKELAMIGRGWVKAGFNFGKLDKSNFHFNKEKGEVHIFGVKAEILNADINPWFIPERKIPGFQIIESKGKVDFYDAVKVKKYCIEKLRRMALEAGILEQAEKQGKEAMKAFLSLVSDVEITEVYFHYNMFAVYANEIIADQYINYNEARLIDSLVSREIDSIAELNFAVKNRIKNQDLKELKIKQLIAGINSFKNCPFEGQNDSFNCFSSLGYKLSADTLLEYDDYLILDNLKYEIEDVLNAQKLLESDISDKEKHKIEYKKLLNIYCWYPDETFRYFIDYNKALENIYAETSSMKFYSDTIFESQESLKKYTTQLSEVDTIIIDSTGNNFLLTLITDTCPHQFLYALAYPLRISDWHKTLCDNENFWEPHKQNLRLGRSITSSCNFNGSELAVDSIHTNNLEAEYSMTYLEKIDSLSVYDLSFILNGDTIPNSISDDEQEIIANMFEYYYSENAKNPISRASSRFKEQLNQRVEEVKKIGKRVR